MTWTTYHRRGDTLRAVVDTADARRDGVLPTDQPGVTENFTDEVDLAGALLLKWHARLSANLEGALVRQPMDLEAAVASAWRTTAEQLPGVRLVVDRCATAPAGSAMAVAMERAQRLERARLAAAAGLAGRQDARAVEIGRRIEERAREGLVLPAPGTGRDVATGEESVTVTGTGAQASPVPAQRPAPREERRPTDRETFVDRLKAALAA